MHPAAFAPFSDQARFPQRPQMMRYQRRAQAQRVTDIADTVLAVMEKLDDAHPIGLGQDLQRLQISLVGERLTDVGVAVVHGTHSNAHL